MIWRLLDRLPDSPFVNFAAGMLFFIGASVALLVVSYAILFSWEFSPLTLIGWGWLALRGARWWAK